MPEMTFAAKWGAPDDAATEFLGNSLRLYSDAHLLFRNERYASCASLSVLALEELAKFMALAGYQPLSRSEWHVHSVKQIKFTTYLMQKRFQAALRATIAERQISAEAADRFRKRCTKLRRELTADEEKPPAELECALDFEEVGEFTEDDFGLFMAAFKQVMADGSLQHFARAYGKEFERIKKRGFYVDIGAKMKVLSTPAAISRDIAKEYLDLFDDVLETLTAQWDRAGNSKGSG